MINVFGDKFVVTGGAGFIGSHIVEELLKQNKEVVFFDNFSNGRKSNLEGEWHIHPTDILDIQAHWFDGHDVIFHNACSKCTVCMNDPLKDLMVNAWGSFKVFDAARHSGSKVVHASTGSVYGDMTFEGFKHDDECVYAPKSFYGVSKLAGEQYLRAFNEYYGLQYVGLRYFHVFGPRQDCGPNGGVVAIFIDKMLNNETITIHGDGEQTRSFTYVKYVVKANFIAANRDDMNGDYYNVASGIKVSINQLVAELADIIGERFTIKYAPAKQGDVKDFNVANDKIYDCGMEDWTDFRTALEETVKWYDSQA